MSTPPPHPSSSSSSSSTSVKKKLSKSQKARYLKSKSSLFHQELIEVSEQHLDQLVLDYLIHKRFSKAAQQFVVESNFPLLVPSKNSSSTPEFNNLNWRSNLSDCIIRGDMETAISLLNSSKPGFLQRHPTLCFELYRQQFIEYIRTGTNESLIQSLDFARTHLVPLTSKIDDSKFTASLEETLSLIAFSIDIPNIKYNEKSKVFANPVEMDTTSDAEATDPPDAADAADSPDSSISPSPSSSISPSPSNIENKPGSDSSGIPISSSAPHLFKYLYIDRREALANKVDRWILLHSADTSEIGPQPLWCQNIKPHLDYLFKLIQGYILQINGSKPDIVVDNDQETDSLYELGLLSK